ncbi:succinate-semialdehyde dehydrogenase/glutarate-semialdehyde dehydrogenase [Pseudomonas sp. PvR086]|jgi:succinate-semialdehyde dehydrogenase/glutarate-semialdehyde dehydrogenase|uniref:NAD-dependent succinate-semialdehyde dehydrogenase n=1 Tax=Pseudomonas TaxID=286 RepID=UPI000B35274A|nr:MULTISPECIES: NAD-dependent succinate-semialdehyde dehydrogenase [Pseudomonas]MBD9606852.1 NAD-dependent succinate-semialdehyde dehydrogenase [Pseudomonas sp. PDM08]MDR7104332.1 succinate-semialdehyde dehydrogenase/glutarate-semialdehyde dehydrogenase [Pseudomonas frederiksbergensis]PMY55161.1 NAD-dependent succinate-semialdehyde dehydrogenase [Pseudomonas sp. FW305-53]PMY88125.1 NAD-dependent succinate-semialdehyde dehydrogenase [Pseudomonas sp. FW303-C2]PMY89877.1 NAD-dependent succinate-
MKLNDLKLLREQAYINGQWVDADDGSRFAVTNPADGEVIAQISSLGQAETARAIAAAQAALPAWRGKTAKDRSKVLRTWFELIMAHQEDLARLLSWEQGKPLAESRGEIAYGASFIEWFAEEAKRVYGDVIPHDKQGRRLVVIKQAIGVVAAITPWNFPNAMITRKVGPALAAGCTVVLKPASETPLSALALAELGERAGIPAGVLNVVTGTRSREIGAELTGNPAVQKLSFTGSTGIGKLLMAQCAQTIKKVSLELGGNAPFIIFEDADLDAAVEGAIGSKFRNSGQTCVCTNRLLVQNSVYDEFARRLVLAVNTLKVARAETEGAQQGPLINAKAVAKVEEHINDALAQGATLLAGGKPHALGGNFFEPTVLGDVTPAMLVARDETFGPLAPLFRFDTEAEAIAMANDTEFGLASYVYTRDLGRAWRVSEALEYGMVGVNEGLISTEVAPFGGIKQSGLGREGSKYGIDDYIEQKYMCLSIK